MSDKTNGSNEKNAVDTASIVKAIDQLVAADREGAFAFWDQLFALVTQFDLAEIGTKTLKGGKVREELRSPHWRALKAGLDNVYPASRVSEIKTFVLASGAWSKSRDFLAGLPRDPKLPRMRVMIIDLARMWNGRAESEGKLGKPRTFNAGHAKSWLANVGKPKKAQTSAGTSAAAKPDAAKPDAAKPDAAKPDAAGSNAGGVRHDRDEPVTFEHIRSEVMDIGNRTHREPDGKRVLAYDVKPILDAIAKVMATGPTVPVDAESKGAESADSALKEALGQMGLKAKPKRQSKAKARAKAQAVANVPANLRKA